MVLLLVAAFHDAGSDTPDVPMGLALFSTTLGRFRSWPGESEVQAPRTRPPYPEEFRREAIRLARLGDEPHSRLAKDLGISDVTLRNWLKEVKASRGERPRGLSSDERCRIGRSVMRG